MLGNSLASKLLLVGNGSSDSFRLTVCFLPDFRKGLGPISATVAWLKRLRSLAYGKACILAPVTAHLNNIIKHGRSRSRSTGSTGAPGSLQLLWSYCRRHARGKSLDTDDQYMQRMSSTLLLELLPTQHGCSVYGMVKC